MHISAFTSIFHDILPTYIFQYNIRNQESAHLSTLTLPESLSEASVRLVDIQISLDHHLWVLFSDNNDQTYGVVCHIFKKIWHDIVAAVTDPLPEVSAVKYVIKYRSYNFENI